MTRRNSYVLANVFVGAGLLPVLGGLVAPVGVSEILYGLALVMSSTAWWSLVDSSQRLGLLSPRRRQLEIAAVSLGCVVLLWTVFANPGWRFEILVGLVMPVAYAWTLSRQHRQS
ncbi:MAG TPA: hypothetical protein VER03_13000 [Bryobacteraceae bacterium]|nr:hypothetical protein [Bryobacteraceae bacterium]